MKQGSKYSVIDYVRKTLLDMA